METTLLLAFCFFMMVPEQASAAVSIPLDAKSLCKKKGGHLATIISAKEEAFVKKLNKNEEYLWLGGYEDADHVWYWVTNEEWKYEDWADGEPSSSFGDTERWLGTYPFKWNDYHMDSETLVGFICEWDNEMKLAEKSLELNVNESFILDYYFTGKTPSGKAVWKSSNKNIAMVNSKSGKIYARCTGTCKITCSLGGYTKSLNVYVKPKRVSGLKKYNAEKSNITIK